MFADIHSMVQLASAQGWNSDREHRRRLPQRLETDAAAGGDLRGDTAQARPRQNALPQDSQRQQGSRLHRQQGSQASLYWC